MNGVVLVSFLLYSINTVSSLQCYSCKSVDPTGLTNKECFPGSDLKKFIVECPQIPQVADMKEKCVTLLADHTAIKFYYRQCLPGQATCKELLKKGNELTGGLNVNLECKTCTDDLCNSATALTSKLSVLTFCFAMIKFSYS